MKQIIYKLLIVLLIVSCTNYNEEIKENVEDYKTLTTANINTDLKVINIVVDQIEFDKMYANFSEDIEIEGSFNLYKNRSPIIENEVIEIQIKGSSSASFTLKSLGIKFDDTYNNKDRKLINPPNLLPFHSIEKVKSLRLRNSGNDFKSTMLKDISYTKLAIEAGLNLDLMYAEQTVVFINDVFMGVMNMRTESNTHGVSRLHNVKKKHITLAKLGIGEVLEKKDGDFKRIDDFITAIENKDFNTLSKEIDVDNFIDYIIFESYIGNTDWPKNNVSFFAIKEEPFRFILYDLDLVAIQNIDSSPMSFIENSNGNPITDLNIITDLFKIMYANKNFKESYDARLQYLMNSELLSAAKFNTIVTKYKENIEHIIPTHINKYKTPETLTNWYFNIEYLKNNFQLRESYVK